MQFKLHLVVRYSNEVGTISNVITWLIASSCCRRYVKFLRAGWRHQTVIQSVDAWGDESTSSIMTFDCPNSTPSSLINKLLLTVHFRHHDSTRSGFRFSSDCARALSIWLRWVEEIGILKIELWETCKNKVMWMITSFFAGYPRSFNCSHRWCVFRSRQSVSQSEFRIDWSRGFFTFLIPEFTWYCRLVVPQKCA